MIFFIWRVQGSYASWKARNARRQARAGSLREGLDREMAERSSFDRKVLTQDPMARDVATIALNLVIGGSPGTYADEAEGYDCMVEAMEFLGEASTANDFET